MASRLMIAPLFAALLLSGGASQAKPNDADEIVALDRAWGTAEGKGDVDFVARLLAPDYRSVDSSGHSHDRAAILKSAEASRSDPSHAARTAAWLAAHPVSPQVLIVGPTAVLRWVSAKEPGTTLSSDIFVRRGGHWQAVYSQHTSAGS